MKTIFILLVIYLGYVIIKGLWAKGAFRPAGGVGVEDQERPAPGARHGAREDEGEEMVQDPVCSSYVPISTAVSIEARQGRVYFCSDQCRDKYTAAPDEPGEPGE
jgi:YHS domain-containing protein